MPVTDEGGLMLVTFTPLQGYAEVVTSFLERYECAPVACTY
ncbi:MAG: hypothetical protein ACR2JB_25480 [Bryobacteraceae bacterium]